MLETDCTDALQIWIAFEVKPENEAIIITDVLKVSFQMCSQGGKLFEVFVLHKEKKRKEIAYVRQRRSRQGCVLSRAQKSCFAGGRELKMILSGYAA